MRRIAALIQEALALLADAQAAGASIGNLDRVQALLQAVAEELVRSEGNGCQ